MKRFSYFYLFAILVVAATYAYLLLTYFWIMTAFIVASSLFSFMVFLVKTRVTNTVTDELHQEQPIDFYKTETRTSYYLNTENTYQDADLSFFNEQPKQANAS